MLIVVSPAKTLDYESPLPTERHTFPELTEHSSELIDVCKTLTPQAISELMKVSDKIAGLNVARFTQWTPHFDFENSRQAIFAFKGDVYTGLEAETLDEEGLEFAQQHLRMLSGLYGVLKPLDLMQPYRLEMGTKLENPRGTNLYQFWGNIITDKLNEEMKKGEVLLNLASNEYFKSVKKKDLNADIITPVFKDEKNGQYKVISFFAKKARGYMAAYVIKNRIKNVEDIKNFDVEGYRYSEEMSKPKEWVFIRDEADA